MATLSGNKIKNTYQALVKFSDNGNITTSAKQLTDGFGNNSPMWVSTTQVGIGVTPEAGLNLHVYGDAKIGSNLTVIGNLVVEGSTTTVGTDTLTVKDPLIVLANNNTSTDAVDIGFYGKYTPSSTTLYSGLFREALTGKYRLFKGLQIEPTTTVSISGTGYDKADLVIGNIETNGVVEDSSLFTFSKDVIINKAGTTKLTIDNVTQNKSIELECTSLNNVLNAEGDMIFSSGSPIFKYTSSNFEVISVDSTFGGDIIANGDITLSNSSKIKWNGTSALEIYDDGTNAIKIETGSSRILDVCSDIFQLKAGDTNNNDLMLTHGSEGVSIYYRGNTNPGVKFATTSDGVDVTGELAVSGTGQSSFGGQVTIPLTPTSSTDAASKGYVDTQVGANNELSEVLANGNITDGTDIVVSTGDQILLPDGNSTNPAITFSGDTNTGMYRTGSDVLNLGVGGSDAISMFPTAVYIKPAGSTELTISSSGSTFAGNVDVTGNIIARANASYYATRNYLGETWELASDTADGVTFKITGGAANTTGNFFKFQTQEGGATAATALTINKDLSSTFAGNVNIGTALITPNTNFNSLVISRNASSGITILSNSANNGGIYFGDENSNNRGQIKYLHASNSMTFTTDDEQRLTIDSSGNVGIGTDSPTDYYADQLVVKCSSSENGITIVSNANLDANYLMFADGTSGADRYRGQVKYNHQDNYMSFATDATERMTIDSDGNVGIGDTTGTSPNSADRFLKIGKSNLQDCSIILQDAVETWEIYQNDDLQFSFGTTPTTVMTMQRTTGNVGIGTASPNTQLEIKGNSTNSFLLNPLYGIGQNIFFNGSAWDSVNHSVGGSIIQLGTDGSFAFRRATAANPPVLSYSMYIDSSGKVGIGGGTIEGKLSIDYTAAELPTSGTTSNSAIQVTSSLGNQLNLGLNTVSGDYGAYIQASDNNLAVPYPLNLQPNGGNVGIGTTSPQEKLHIVGLDGSVPLSSYYGSLVIDNNGEAAMSIIGNSYSSIYFGDADTNFVGAINYQHSVNAMIFKTNDNTEKMRITSSGNVNIATPITNAFYGLALQYNATDTAEFKVNQATGEIKIGGTAAGYFPTFYAGGTERMRIDSSGSLIVGTATVAAANAAADNFVIKGEGAAVGLTISNSLNSGTGTIFFGDAVSSSVAGFRYNHNTGDMAVSFEDDITFSNSGGEKMRIRSTGSLVGTHESSAGIVTGLQLVNPINAAGTGHGTSILLHCTDGDPNRGVKIASSSTSNYAIDNDMLFYTSAGSTLTEKMRITSGGVIQNNILTTTQSSAVRFSNSNFSWGMIIEDDQVNNGLILFSAQNGDSVGSITRNGLNTQFNTSSDYRLKEDLQDFAGLDMVSKIPVYDFKWKTDESRSYGVMAHELQEVLPDAVAGEKDAVNEDESISPQGVDYSKIVPLLVKSIQELKAEIDDLKNKCNCK